MYWSGRLIDKHDQNINLYGGDEIGSNQQRMGNGPILILARLDIIHNIFSVYILGNGPRYIILLFNI